MNLATDLLEQMACDGMCPGSEILRLRALVAELESERDELRTRLAENESRLAERTAWLVTRLRHTAQGIEERYRPLDEEVPKTKQT